MNDQRQHADQGGVGRPRSSSRRGVIAGLGAGLVTAVAGCVGAGTTPTYEAGTVGDVDGDARNASEMAAAEAVAQTAVDETLSTLDAIDVEDHRYVLEDGYTGSTVQGTLRNTGNDRLESVEVRVRVYDDRDRHLGRYVATTGDLSPGSTWNFTVVLLVSPSDVATYDLAALGRSA